LNRVSSVEAAHDLNYINDEMISLLFTFCIRKFYQPMTKARYSGAILPPPRCKPRAALPFFIISLSTHQLITAFTREVASSYLAETLSPTVESLIEGPTLELDPSKISGVDLGQQTQLLGEKCNQVLRMLQQPAANI
jgi:hypothetical protein